MVRFPALFSPINIGGVMLKNRIVMAPMAANYAHLDGEVSERQIAYYQSRARGGAGLIIVEAACIDAPAGREGFGQILIDHPRYLRGLSQLADSIKSCGSRAFIQLFHAGRQAHTIITGVQPVAPSAVACATVKDVPRELSITEVQDIRNKFIAAAGYAYMAGFDGVELHAAHGYLINEFLSPDSNLRQDEYGGSLDNRARLLMEIVLEKSEETLAALQRQLLDAVIENWKVKEREFSVIITALDKLSPLKVLSRGYAVVRQGDKIVRQVEEVIPGSSLQIDLSDGIVDAKVVNRERVERWKR
jgi:2,4-dienoyl-CoA reductase-like NADH-dependent reductase (Old Yellow Enzyme family)